MLRINYVLAAMLAILLAVPANAMFLPTESRYPVEDGEPLYKIYDLQTEEQIEEIPREDISYNGKLYRFSTVSTEPQTETETKEYRKTVNRGTALTNDPASILAVMEPTKDITTEDGFSGTVEIVPETLAVEPETYGSTSRTVTLTRTYPSMAEMDVALLPQSLSENGLTYNLTDCSWALTAAANPYDVELSDSYTATAVYTAKKSSRYVKTYSFSIDYAGTLTRERVENYHCIAVFLPAPNAVPSKSQDQAQIEAQRQAGSTGLGWKLYAGGTTVAAAGLGGALLKMGNKKKTLMLLLTIGMMSLMGGVNADALSYQIEGAEIQNTAQPTSVLDYTLPAADVAADLSKNAAFAPPAFGSPESYIPNRSEPLIDLRGTDGSTYGVVIGDGSLDGHATADVRVANGFPVVDDDPVVLKPATAYTELTAQDYYSDGHIGNIKIAAIGVDFSVYEGADTKTMNKGAAHITNTSVWDGNVCLAAHNRGVANNFGKIQTLREGDLIVLSTAHGTRVYSVFRVEKIAETDTSILAPSVGNMLTLTTCVANERAYRYVVQAVQIL